MRIQAPQVKYARYADGILAGVVAIGVTAIATTQIINYLAPIHYPLITHLKYWAHGLLDICLGYKTESWKTYSIYLDAIAKSNSLFSIQWRMYAVATTSLAAGLYSAWWAGKPISDLTKVSGNDLLRDAEAVKHFNSHSEKDGLELANGIKFDVNKETEHFLISGGTGAGKSVSAMNILVPAINRGDRILLVNYKGLTEKFPITLNTESKTKYFDAVILCPFDSRSVVWAIWKDIKTKSHAREFSARVIPESKDPIWSNTSRFVLTGVLMYLIHNYTEKGETWSYKQLAELCLLDRESLVKILTKHYPEGLRAIKDEGKTSESVLMNFAAFVAPIIDLAEVWGDKRKGFSIEEWVNSPNSKVRVVILQISSEFKLLSQAFNQSILNQLGTYLTRLPDIKASQSPLWIYADEFPRLGKAEVFEELFSAGRSKSLRAMIAIQSISQLKKEYGIDLTDNWIDSIGTKIMGRQDGQGAKWLSEMCGEATYVQLQNGRSENDGNGRQRITYSAPQSYAVFPPQLAQNELGIVKQSFIAKLFKMKKKGVRMMIHGVKGAELIINFPFTQLASIRKETELALIFKGGNIRSENNDIESVISEIIITSDQQSKINAAETFISEESVLDMSVAEMTDTELLYELTKDFSGEVMDAVTDSHISLALETIDLLSEVADSKNQTANEHSVSTVQLTKKKRYLSKRDRSELQIN